ncbi:hypothetical protein HDU82_008885, partial [Entophlyctis luteolus]
MYKTPRVGWSSDFIKWEVDEAGEIDAKDIWRSILYDKLIAGTELIIMHYALWMCQMELWNRCVKALPRLQESLHLGTINHVRCALMRSPTFAAEWQESPPWSSDELACTVSERRILSNDASNPHRDVYYIWSSEGVSESTYRDLLARIPSTRPLVGRACIVAGYDELYSELELEPDASYVLEALAQGNSKLAARLTSERPQDWLKTRMDDHNGKLMPEAKALGSRGCYSIVTYPRTLYRARILKRSGLELKLISSDDIGSIG